MNYEIATNPEQSKRLQACGVDPATADMYLSINLCEGENYGKYSIHILGNNNWTWRGITRQHDYELAWSLPALLKLLPDGEGQEIRFSYNPFPIFDTSEHDLVSITPTTLEGDVKLYRNDDGYWIVDYDWEGFMGTLPQSRNPIEAVVLAIELLYANGIELRN